MEGAVEDAAALPGGAGEAQVGEEPCPAADEPVTGEAAAACSFHLSCKSFKGSTQNHLRGWLEKILGGLDFELSKKQRNWTYCTVQVPEAHRAKFAEPTPLQHDGNDVRCSVHKPEGKAPSKRRAPERPEGEAAGGGGGGGGEEAFGEPSSKRQKGGGADAARQPVLKELRERAKHRKRSFEGSALERSAPLMQWDYPTQLAMKNGYVKTCVRSFSKLALKRCEKLCIEAPAWCLKDWSVAVGAPHGCCCPLDEPIGAPEETLRGWRNKCEFTIGRDEAGEVEVGFVLKVLPSCAQVVGSVQEVPLVPACMQRLAASVVELVKASPFPIFDRKEGVKAGVWRMLMARVNPAGQMLVMLQTTTLEAEARRSFEEALLAKLTAASEGLGVISVYLQFNDEVTDAARPNAPVALVHGEPRLEMPLLGLRLGIGPLSFFNPNTATCKMLMETTIKYLCPQSTDVILDIFCGVGTIGLCAAAHAKQVIGVEIVAEAVEDAKQNAARNGISNAVFHAGKAEDLMPRILGDMDDSLEVCAVVDPARAGLHPKLVEMLRNRTQVVRIVYVSCNAESMAEDVARLGSCTDPDADVFVPVRTVAVDSFPQTFHVEVIQLLERRSRVPDPRTAGTGGTNSVEQSTP